MFSEAVILGMACISFDACLLSRVFQVVLACNKFIMNGFHLLLVQDISLSIPLPGVVLHEEHLFCSNASEKVSHYCHWELEDKIQR